MAPPSSSYMSLTSENAPTLVKVGACVLPSSTTSGVFSASGSEVVSLVSRSPHDCSSTTSVAPVFALNAVFR